VSVREQIEAEIEVVAGKVKDFKSHAAVLIELHRQVGDTLAKATSCLRVIQSKKIVSRNDELMKQIQTLTDSVDQISQSRNRMDLGTFVVRTDRVMDAVWKEMP